MTLGCKTTYPPRRPVRRKRRPPPWISLRHAPCRTPGISLRVSAFQTDRGRLRYIEPLACAHPLRVHDDAETASAISLKQASTIAEMRIRPIAARAVLRATPLLARNGRRAIGGEPAPAPAARTGLVLGPFALPAPPETAPTPTWHQGTEPVGRSWVTTHTRWSPSRT